MSDSLLEISLINILLAVCKLFKRNKAYCKLKKDQANGVLFELFSDSLKWDIQNVNILLNFKKNILYENQ